MFFTSAIVLLVGLVRWYMGMSRRRSAPAESAASESRFSAVAAKIAGLLAREPADEVAVDDVPAPRRSRQHSIDRTATAAKTASGTTRKRSGRPVKRTQPSRSRHTRPPETEIIEPVAERPPRRPRSSSTREPRKQPPPSERRSPYQRPDRHSRFDGFEPFEPHGTNGSNGSSANNGSLNGTHHPVSRVRYRGADDGDQRPQYRARPRASKSKHQADAWEYDV